MTRETKIGLLVGLAFIIVIGILLSDHLTQSTEPQPAVLAVAGSGVRSGISVPGVGGSNAAPPITQVPSSAAVTPTNPVPTRDELTPHAPPVQIVKVGAPTLTTTTPGAPRPIDPPADQSSSTMIAPEPPSTPTSGGPVVTSTAPDSSGSSINAALRDAAKQIGEELVTPGGGATNQSTNPATITSGKSTLPTGVKSYVAAEGDSVSKMAAKFLGGNTKPNREAIIAVNPSLKADPNKIIVGRTYLIPTSATVANSDATAAPAAPVAKPAPVATSATDKENWYTVKDGDTLGQIAQEQCGTVAAIPAILELNKETLKDANHVVVNMKLRLPNKPVASAN